MNDHTGRTLRFSHRHLPLVSTSLPAFTFREVVMTSMSPSNTPDTGLRSRPTPAANVDALRAELIHARNNLEQLEDEYRELLANHDVMQEDRDSTRQLLEEARQHVADADRAVARAESGTYGICEQCGEPIAAERLEALPGTSRCVNCA